MPYRAAKVGWILWFREIRSAPFPKQLIKTIHVTYPHDYLDNFGGYATT